ncbi:PAS domain-containing sensor histidine kinase [Hymenobacter convexus]|uniref:PAS domain-containing sensor histidine kinase n=1 Tax=Hymenobacter sp. CA1UV-4 TaxID=3063782 RepID=UPI00271367A1|nr:PAS domain-containing protein [Hymenobacter sp. CA1UV-4]MDO7853800.1 PAS domain-containing protein [Hymenobacter sp. CA1UV-4]
MPDSSASAPPHAAPAPDDLLRAVLEVSLAPINLLRPVWAAEGGAITDFQLDYLNPAAQRLTGLAEQPGGTLQTHFPNAFGNGLFDFYRRVFETGHPDQLPLHYHPDQPTTFLQVAARRHAGQVVASFLDAAQGPRTAVETALRESRAREQAAHAEAERQRAELQRVFEQAPLAIAVYRGPNYVIELANPTVCRLWGRSQRDILGKGLFEALPEVAGMGYEQLLDEVMATGVPYVAHGMEAQHDRNGRRDTLYWDFVYVPMHEADGSVRGVMVVATDATTQVRARQQMQQLNDELEMRVTARSAEARAAQFEAEQQREYARTQQALLGQILRQVPASIATLMGPEHRYTYFNDQYQALTAGRTVLGQTVADVLPEVKDQGFIGLLDEVYATGQPFIGSDTPIMLLDPATGQAEQRYVDLIYQPLFDAHQQPQGILAFILDVTDKVRARQHVQELNEELATSNQEIQATNQELNYSNHRLTRTNADLDTFVYTASHDLKVPIANIEGLLLALRHDLPPEVLAAPLVARLLNLMQGSVARFQQTIGHLTDISQLQQSETAETVDLAELIEDVRLDLAPLIEAAPAALTVALDGCDAVRVAPKALRSVVYNLLSNAVKYRAPTRPAQVQLRAHCAPGRLTLEVQDNGLGLSAAQQGQLFGMFRRLHTHVEGSGVGLFMVKRLIENAGGTIEVQSEPGVGSTFRVMLPA